MNTFYILVVGSRTITDYELVSNFLDYLLGDIPLQSHVVVVSGGAKGVDTLAEMYANECGFELKTFPLTKDDWYITDTKTCKKKYNKKAGYDRNKKMHEYIAQFPNRGVVAFWDGESKGTLHSVELAKQYNNPIKLVNVPLFKESLQNIDKGEIK